MRALPTDAARRARDRAGRAPRRARLLPRDLSRRQVPRRRHRGCRSCRTTTRARARARCAACTRSSARTRRASWCARCAATIFDVAVDMRRGSPTFGRWVGVRAVGRELPPAVGAARLSARVLRAQRVGRRRPTNAPSHGTPAEEISVRWDDPRSGHRLADRRPVLSAKDAARRARCPVLDRLAALRR